MLTQTIEHVVDFTELPTQTSPNVDPEAYAGMHQGYRDAYSAAAKPRFSSLAGYVGRWILAATAVTTPLGYYDPRQEELRSGASSLVWAFRRKEGHAISLAEARKIALRIMEETEERLHEERAVEAQFLLSFWEDEDAV